MVRSFTFFTLTHKNCNTEISTKRQLPLQTQTSLISLFWKSIIQKKKITVSQTLARCSSSDRLLQNRHDSRPSFIWTSEIRAVLLVSSDGSSQCVGLQVRCCSSTVRALMVAEHNTRVCPLEASPGHQPALLAFRPEIAEEALTH